MTEDSGAVRQEIVRVARLLRSRGLAIGTSGNVGARLADGRIAITPSTMDYDEMTADDIVIVEADGSPSEGRHRPSSELALHVAVLGARPEARAIVHTHSPFATAWAATRRPLPAAHYMLAQVYQQTARAEEAKREFALAEKLQGDADKPEK